eukprot:36390_1
MGCSCVFIRTIRPIVTHNSLLDNFDIYIIILMNQLPNVLISLINDYAIEPDIKVALIGAENGGKHSFIESLFSNKSINKNENIFVEKLPAVSEVYSPLIQFTVFSTPTSMLLHRNMQSQQQHIDYNKQQNELLISLESKYDLIMIFHDTTNPMIASDCTDLLQIPNFENTLKWLIVSKLDSNPLQSWMSTTVHCAQLMHLYNITGPTFLLSTKVSKNIEELKQALCKHSASLKCKEL